MYFVLSKILLFLILPINWIVVLLAIAIVNKQPKRKWRFLIAAGVVFYIFTIPVLLNAFASLWDIRTQTDGGKKYSCVIVLGGFTSAGPQGGFFNSAADRFIQGVELLETKKASHILISGGNGTLVPGEFREATWTRLQLKKFNIPDSLILVESNSKNTLENAGFSKILLEKAHLPPPYLLVTSAFHMRRSLMIFKHAGIAVVPYSCNFLTGDNHFILQDFMPDADIIARWNYYVKELVGYAVNYFKK